MRTSIRFTTWFFIPGLLILALANQDPRLAMVAAVAMWCVASTMGPLALVTLLATLSLKPTDATWQETVEKSRANAPGATARLIGWLSLFISVALAAYSGLVVTAVFYLVGQVWVRCAWGMCRHHFENATVKQ
ncbi:hypothetical protein D3C77_49070 [compost metagenome]